ncbi:ATP-binding cassette domain-containing protein [Rhodococcus sp. HM1]|uniref:Peptide/nickel transport system ATP-binding protein/oligopeptide transport system ATP-binding protein n=1 Tax=Rhodococcus rhodochrous J45 TaxID=935266 RepID=A0A562E7H0_RHORH|nr:MULTISPECIES: ATP-binding cassette domain-containing protein [Rhodococcus]MCB8913927.1 ATP-binding cassette domain-containing protein [Rhodococcus rhodochrous]MCK8675084.1 ATP-binding cassette domain-containing protein [Rhodococcus sp. HM1]TWH17965.1 peptide/nickel transport system ATP-binding protein/oligopeptide transport system ATP-binding protein [Rhodococcus rhodochrous J45]
MSPLLEVAGLRKSFPATRNLFGRVTERTVVSDEVSFTVGRGETLGIVGESGAGKSTVGRQVLRLIEPDSGTITFDGDDVRKLKGKDLLSFRRRAQMIFQDPFSSLDPHMTIRNAVGEPLTIHYGIKGAERDRHVVEMLERVGMRADQLDKYPREFSGGQLQRIAIARALTLDPDFIVCDEPVAALDVSIQAQVLNLLLDLQAERGLSYIFISHDLSLVRFLAHRVVVMYRGQVVETGTAEELFENPQHPYTKTLVAAVPDPRARRCSAAVPALEA